MEGLGLKLRTEATLRSQRRASVVCHDPSLWGWQPDDSSGMSNTNAPPPHPEWRKFPTRSDTMKKETTQLPDKGANSFVPTTGVSVS